MEEKMFWIKMLNEMKEDTLELPKIDLAELMTDYFSMLPRKIKLNRSKYGLLKHSL